MASTSTPGSLSTSGTSSTHNLTCEVFLSFRGPDTRLGFTSHLYWGLKRQGIDAFRDEENLEKGFEIHPYLKAAIEKSQYAVVIISERFADSKSCLIELSEIMERKRKECITVFPVFYHVEPSDVRHQKGMFGEHFTQFRKEVGSKVDTAEWEKWTGALKEVGKLKGWHVQNSDEAEIVKEISLKILYGLVANPKYISASFFGIETQVEDIINMLSLGSCGVRFIGICGIGGIGKSTLARVVRAKVSPEFCASCIIDVGKDDILKLGKQLVHELISREASELVETMDKLKMTLEESKMLKGKKVLIVLDDLHEVEKLKVLAKAKWFGNGSRIIITSRDRKWPCLDKDNIYDVKMLTGRAALQLFCSNAFPKGNPEEEFRELIEELVNLAKGLPLALEFYGSHVKGEGKGYWEGYRDELKENLDEGVKSCLQITFNRLNPRLRDAFLDIVCFFNNFHDFGRWNFHKKDVLKEALVWLGHSSNILIDLENKSLLKFVKDERMFEEGKLSIHDLLVQMGEEIANKERLWRHEDIISELQGNSGKTGIDKLKVFQLVNHFSPVELPLAIFEKMKKLRMVLICCPLSIEWFGEYLELKPGNELRYWRWDWYPFESLPVGFNPTNLIKLELRLSKIQRLWDGNGCFPKLKEINLSSSTELKEIPDLSQVPSLEILDLSTCTNLSLIHPSIGLLKHLKELNFEYCRSLERLPDKITSNSLKVLKLGGCSKLKALSNEIHSKSLEYLDLSDCSKLKNLPTILGEIQSLQYIDISRVTIEEFLFSFRRLRSLKEFTAMETRIGELLVDIDFHKEGKRLGVGFLDSNTSLGLPLLPLSSSKCRILHGCIPSDEAESNDLSSYYDGHREFLETLFSNLKYLLEVSLGNCDLEAIPKCIGYWSVSRLDLSCNRFMELPDSMCELSNILELILDNCTSLRALPKLPLSLIILSLINCPLLPANDNASLVSYIGFDCKPHKILVLPYEDQYDLEMWSELSVACSPMIGLEIPEWFIHKEFGSSKAIRIHMDWDGRYPRFFCALLIVYEVHRHDKSRSRKRKFDEPENSNISACEGSNGIFPEFVCQLQRGELSPQQIIIRVPEAAHVGTHGIFLFMDFRFYPTLELGKRWSCLVSVPASSENVKLKEFAAHPVNLNSKYEFDEDFSNISQLDLDSKSMRDLRCLALTGPIE